MTRICKVLTSFLALLFLTECHRDIAQAQPPKAVESKSELDGHWTCIYELRTSPGGAFKEFGGGIQTMSIAGNRIDRGERDPYVGGLAYVLPPKTPGVMEMYRVDAKGRIDEETRVRYSYVVRDSFLVLKHERVIQAAPDKSGDVPTETTVTIWRRYGWPEHAVPVRMGKEASSIRGDWTMIYYEGLEFYFSFVNMEDLHMAGSTSRRRMPFAEYLPRRWNVDDKELHEEGSALPAAPARSIYGIRPEAGEITITPLDRDSRPCESIKKIGIYTVIDNFLIVCYHIPGSDRFIRIFGEQRPREFRSWSGSRNAVVILRRSAKCDVGK